MYEVEGGEKPKRGFHERFTVTDDTVSRTVDTRLLTDYDDEEGVYDPEVLAILGVEEASAAEQLTAILDASDAILTDVDNLPGITVVPFERTEVDEDGRVVVEATRVTPVEGAALADKAGYIAGVAEYYQEIMTQVQAFARGEREHPPLYHTDLARPTQYVFGTVSEEEPLLYMVDPDPEITTAAAVVDGELEVDIYLINGVTELAAVSHGKMECHEEVEQLIESMKASGLVPRVAMGSIEDAFRTGKTYLRDEEELAFPEY